MEIQQQLLTIDEFYTLSNSPENAGERWELIEGVMTKMAPSSQRNSIIAGLIGHYFNAYNIEHQLGYISGADGGYELAPGTVRLPDVGFISKNKNVTLNENAFPAPPDLAVEVVSKNDSASNVRNKVKLYLDAGTEIVWVVYPDDKSVDVCTLTSDGKLVTETLSEHDSLQGGDVLPNFTLAVAKIFPE
jgi:Uma2 family endonuclease